MRTTTEDFLYSLLWGAEILTRPSNRHITESFEAWAFRRGFLRHLHRIEQRKLIEQISDTAVSRRSDKSDGTVQRVFRLTEAGRLMALGGIDPEKRWERRWDGKWRIISFDLPIKHNAARARLRRHLKERGFGYLQQSLWISPDPLEKDLKDLAAKGEDVESIFTLAARPCSGESDESIVAGAWDFQQIQRLYEKCLGLLRNPPSGNDGKARDVEKLREWTIQERASWRAVLAVDPLLPKKLLPQGYLGPEVWRLRNSILRGASQTWLQKVAKVFPFGPPSVSLMF